MSHELWRLRESLYNTPLYSDQETLKSVVSYLTARNNGDIKVDKAAEISSDTTSDETRYAYNPNTQTAVMNIMGPLTYRPISFMGMDCGGQSYVALKEDMEDAVSRGVKTVVFNVDSGGGYAFGMIQTAEYLRQLADDNGVEIISYVDGRSASAAYGLTCISDQIIAHPDAQLGSIGVIIELLNDSEALKKDGYERTFIYAGNEKQPFAPDGSWREGFLKRLKTEVDDSYEKFTSLVADMRSLPQSAVKDTQAAMFSVEEAINKGLADLIMAPETFYQWLADRAEMNMGKSPVNVNRLFKSAKTEDITEMAKLEEMQAALIEKEALLSSNQEAISALTASVEQLQSQLQASAEALTKATAAVAEMEKAKAEAAVASRKAQLSEVLAADQVEANFAALAGLDDASFGVVLGQFKAVKEARAASFAALGSDAAVELEEQEESQPDGAEAIRLAGVARAKALAGKR